MGGGDGPEARPYSAHMGEAPVGASPGLFQASRSHAFRRAKRSSRHAAMD